MVDYLNVLDYAANHKCISIRRILPQVKLNTITFGNDCSVLDNPADVVVVVVVVDVTVVLPWLLTVAMYTHVYVRLATLLIRDMFKL